MVEIIRLADHRSIASLADACEADGKFAYATWLRKHRREPTPSECRQLAHAGVVAAIRDQNGRWWTAEGRYYRNKANAGGKL